MRGAATPGPRAPGKALYPSGFRSSMVPRKIEENDPDEEWDEDLDEEELFEDEEEDEEEEIG